MTAGSSLALDTNAYSDWQRGTKWSTAVSKAHLVYMPLIVLAELRAGFASGTKTNSNASVLEQFLSSNHVKILSPDETTTKIYGRVFAQLKSQGTPIPTNDLWISALALQHNLPLATSDSHFSAIPQLELL